MSLNDSINELAKALAGISWEQPKKPELRCYHDSRGRVLFYSNEEHAESYILVDAPTFAANRLDWYVKNGKLHPPIAVIGKLVPSQQGVACHAQDVTVLAEHGAIIHWSPREQQD